MFCRIFSKNQVYTICIYKKTKNSGIIFFSDFHRKRVRLTFLLITFIKKSLLSLKIAMNWNFLVNLVYFFTNFIIITKMKMKFSNLINRKVLWHREKDYSVFIFVLRLLLFKKMSKNRNITIHSENRNINLWLPKN